MSSFREIAFGFCFCGGVLISGFQLLVTVFGGTSSFDPACLRSIAFKFPSCEVLCEVIDAVKYRKQHGCMCDFQRNELTRKVLWLNIAGKKSASALVCKEVFKPSCRYQDLMHSIFEESK